MPVYNTTFNGNDGDTITTFDPNWTIVRGAASSATIQSNNLEIAGFNHNAAYYATSAEGRSKISVPWPAQNTARRHGPAINMSATSYITVMFSNSNGTQMNLLEVAEWEDQAGTWTKTFSSLLPDTVDGVGYDLEIVETANNGTDVTVEVFLNDVSAGTVTITGAVALSGNDGYYLDRSADYEGVITDFSSGPLGAPVLSAPTLTGETDTQATVGATTDQSDGTFYAVIDTAANISGITAAQVKAGNNNGDVAALGANSAANAVTNPSITITGMTLTIAATYHYAAVQNNTQGDSNVVTGSFVVPGLVIGSAPATISESTNIAIAVTNAGETTGVATLTDSAGTSVALNVTAWPNTGGGDGNVNVDIPGLFASNLLPGTVTILLENTGQTESDSVQATLNMVTDWNTITVVTQDTSAEEYLTAQDGASNPVPIVAGDIIAWESVLRLESDNSQTAYAVTVNNDCTYTVPNTVPEARYELFYRVYDSSDNTWGTADSRGVNLVTSTPVFTGPINAPVATVGSSYSFSLAQYFGHSAGKALTYSFANLPAGVTQNPGAPAVIDGVPTTEQTVTATVTVTDTDNVSSGPHEFILRANQAPQWSAIPAQNLRVGNAVSLDLSGYVSDPDTLSLSVTTLPTGLSLAGTTISGTVSTVESVSSTVFADDNHLTSQTTISWTITASPVLGVSIPAQSLLVGDTVNINLNDYFTDADGDALTFTSTPLPSGLTLDGNTGIVSGSVDTVEVVGVVFTANDGTDTTDSNSVSFAINDVPNFSGPIPDKYTVVGNGDTLNLASYFTDSDTLFYQVVSGTLPAGMSLNQTTGVISGTPSAEGSASLIFSATDGEQTTNTNAVTWVTNAAPLETAPIATMTPRVNDAVSFNLNDYVSDFFPMTFSATNLPSGLTLDASTGIVSGNVDTVDSYTVQFSANDGYITTNLTPVNINVSAGLGVDFSFLSDVRNSALHPDSPSVLRANETGVKIWVVKDGALLNYGDDYTTDANGLPPAIQISDENSGVPVTIFLRFSNGDGSPPIETTIGSLA